MASKKASLADKMLHRAENARKIGRNSVPSRQEQGRTRRLGDVRHKQSNRSGPKRLQLMRNALRQQDTEEIDPMACKNCRRIRGKIVVTARKLTNRFRSALIRKKAQTLK